MKNRVNASRRRRVKYISQEDDMNFNRAIRSAVEKEFPTNPTGRTQKG